MNTHFYDGDAGETPPALNKIIGVKVDRVWTTSDSLLVLFEDQQFLEVQFQSLIAGSGFTLRFDLGTVLPGQLESILLELDSTARRSDHTRFLEGRTFTGLDIDVLVFDRIYGVRVTKDGIEWVRKPVDEHSVDPVRLQ